MIADDEPVTLADAPAHAMTMIEAINDALDTMLERDPDVVLMGEDIGYFGGVFRCTAGTAGNSDTCSEAPGCAFCRSSTRAI